MCPFSKNPLPFRRLKEYANGIWDEERQTFYPFKAVYDTSPPAKPGIAYYLKSVQTVIKATGIVGGASGYVTGVVGGETARFGIVAVPAMTQATDYWSSVCDFNVGVLCDVNTALTCIAATYVTIVYAEIPADVGGYNT